MLFQHVHSGLGKALEVFAAPRTAAWKRVKTIAFSCIFAGGAGLRGFSMAGPGPSEVSGSSWALPGHLQRRYCDTWDDQGISESLLEASQERMNALGRFLAHKT